MFPKTDIKQRQLGLPMRIGIVGAGHVGLPTAGALCELGHEVRVTDIDHEKLADLSRGVVPFVEPGLEKLIRRGLQSSRLTFTSDPEDFSDGLSAAFICVGTPPKVTGEANLAAVERSAVMVARHARGRLVVIEKSTVPTGTAGRLAHVLNRHNPEVTFLIVSNPEFLREGQAVHDSMHPSRIVVGTDSPEAFAFMRRLYQPYLNSGARLFETDLQTAELAKHACNAYLALKVSFANAMAQVCERTHADVTTIRSIMESDPRIGVGHLNAGLGYGGSCFPKDLAAFQRLVHRIGYRFPLLDEIQRLNDEALGSVFSKIEDVLWNLEGKKVALLGLAFKAGTDDVRYSPALNLAERLLAEGVEVAGYDPAAGDAAREALPALQVSDDAYSALMGANCAVLCTEWDEFRHIDTSKIKEVMAWPILIDGRNLFDPNVMRDEGFVYLPTGRPAVVW